MAFRRSSDGQLPLRGRAEQYLGMMYSSSPATQSPRRPPAAQSILGWKRRSAHWGSFAAKRLAHFSVVHVADGGGGGSSAVVVDPMSTRVVKSASAVEEAAADGGGELNGSRVLPSAAGRLAAGAVMDEEEGKEEEECSTTVCTAATEAAKGFPATLTGTARFGVGAEVPDRFSCARYTSSSTSGAAYNQRLAAMVPHSK
jgi:hypothetical protein